MISSYLFLHDTATTEIYTLSLHDALPILKSAVGWPSKKSARKSKKSWEFTAPSALKSAMQVSEQPDRKSTRLNSSHSQISYAVFCLKKKTRGAVQLLPFALNLGYARALIR